LIPYDFSGFSDVAFEKAVEIGKKFDSKITLLTIIGNDVDTSGMSFSRAQEAQDEEEKKAKDEMNKIKESIEGMDISVEIIHNSSTVDGILLFVEKNDIDLIVMGSHGRSGFKKLVLGSVASAIITRATCPVLTDKSSKPKRTN
ncbi:MAG: universal stress protein, partial [Nitrosopumilus sp.]|nr:universal stress protein [Nitrosopumilus sp.]